jgi:predicted small lipoprotein YifL
VKVSDTAKSVAIVLVLAALAGCGKKGPPLVPLRLVPAAVGELTARRSGDDVELQFSLPTVNATGPEAIDLAKVEIYAVTVAAGAVTPPNRDLLTTARVVGTIAVRPPPVEGEAPAPGEQRPAPGERVTFVDQLTAAKLTPVVLVVKPEAVAVKPDAPGQPPAVEGQKPDPAAKPDATGQKPDVVAPKPEVTAPKPEGEAVKPEAGAPAAQPAAAPVGSPYPTRIYAIRGLSRSNRPGPPSTRVVVPLVGAVAPPSAVVAQMPTEKAVVVDWTPPVAEAGMPPLAFNVYRREDTTTVLNPSPLAEPKFEIGSVEYGKEQCFVVRTVQALQNVTLESPTSAPACLTPLDKFPPSAPKGLRTVAEDGAVSLVWDQNAEADLDGYLVLRGEVPGDTLQPLTPQPITDASYRDATVKPGVRYVYVVVAVDNAAPRNQSPPSAREEVTARAPQPH